MKLPMITASTRKPTAFTRVQVMAPSGDAGAGGQSDDERQHDESEDVVDDCGADDSARLAGVHLVEVREHPSSDPHRGGGERGAHEDRHLDQGHAFRVRPQARVGQVPVARAEEERHGHSDQRDHPRRSTHVEHLPQVGLEPHLEQQDHHADLGQQMDGLRHRITGGGGDDSQHASAQDHPADQLAQHRRLPNPLGELARELPNHQDRHQDEHEASHLMAARWRTALLPGGFRMLLRRDGRHSRRPRPAGLIRRRPVTGQPHKEQAGHRPEQQASAAAGQRGRATS